MAQVRTRAQKIKAAQMREVQPFVYTPLTTIEEEKSPAGSAPTEQNAVVHHDFRRTLVATAIVLGVLLLILVYTHSLST